MNIFLLFLRLIFAILAMNFVSGELGYCDAPGIDSNGPYGYGYMKVYPELLFFIF